MHTFETLLVRVRVGVKGGCEFRVFSIRRFLLELAKPSGSSSDMVVGSCFLFRFTEGLVADFPDTEL